MNAGAHTVWLFDLDDTLHNAHGASMDGIRQAMSAYMCEHLGLSDTDARTRRELYWQRYGATLLGMVKHDGVKAAHFLHQTHILPGLEARVHGHRADLLTLKQLPGRKYILTNAPIAYAKRVLGVLGIVGLFDGLLSIEDMHMFGQLRPKPDARMLRWVAAQLRVPPERCVLVEDTLEHQKAARSIGMRTVWMQRWLRQAKPAARLRRCPAYVTRRVTTLRDLRR